PTTWTGAGRSGSRCGAGSRSRRGRRPTSPAIRACSAGPRTPRSPPAGTWATWRPSRPTRARWSRAERIGPARPLRGAVGLLPHAEAVPAVALPGDLARVLRAAAGGGRGRPVGAAARGTRHRVHGPVPQARHDEPALQRGDLARRRPRADRMGGRALPPPHAGPARRGAPAGRAGV